MSLYDFISLLYKLLLQYTLLKSFSVPSALLTKFPKISKEVPYETFSIGFHFHNTVDEENTLLWRRHVSFESQGLLQNTLASFLLLFVNVQA